MEKKASVRLQSRLGWRHQVLKEQPLEYKVEELKLPLPPWRVTKMHFEEVKLEKRKD